MMNVSQVVEQFNRLLGNDSVEKDMSSDIILSYVNQALEHIVNDNIIKKNFNLLYPLITSQQYLVFNNVGQEYDALLPTDFKSYVSCRLKITRVKDPHINKEYDIPVIYKDVEDYNEAIHNIPDDLYWRKAYLALEGDKLLLHSDLNTIPLDLRLRYIKTLPYLYFDDVGVYDDKVTTDTTPLHDDLDERLIRKAIEYASIGNGRENQGDSSGT